MYCIALTGGIASGKSTVASFFLELGIEVISADAIAKELTLKDQFAYQAIVEHFGTSILTESHELNRSLLRKLIFKQKDERLWLESLLHPLIRQTIEARVQRCKSKYCVIEIPLLVNKEDYPYLNRILLVESEGIQNLNRLMIRDNSTKEDAQLILNAQVDETVRQKLADDRIVNNGTLAQLRDNVRILHQKYSQHP